VRRTRLGLVTGAVLIALAGAGCGYDSDDDAAAPSASSTTASDSQGGIVEEAKANLETNYEGTDRALPAEAPAPPKNMNVWVIACSTAAEGCAAPANGAIEAAKALGWKTTLVDGKLDPGVYNSAVRDAVANGADAIILASVDCALTKASLAEAKKAGVKIAGLYGIDCDNKYAGGGKKLFDAEIIYADGMTYGEWLPGPYAQSAADYVIAKTDGKANVVSMREDDVTAVRLINDGFEARTKECDTCELTVVPFSGPDLLGGKLQGKTQTALTQNPQADVVFAPYDAAAALGIAAGVKGAGRDKDVLLVGGEGLSPSIGMIKSGSGQDVAIGAPARWAGWAVIDELIRAVAGEPLVDEGIGVQTIDREHPLQTDTPFYDGNGKEDYKANFRTIWGLEK
jgi:ribose transport system substrate-binding protein